MKDLRLNGVRHEDGERRLDLVDDEGREYTLTADDALRAAVARPAPAAVRRPSPAAAPRRAALSPRDVQARIRAGATVEEMIEASGLDPAHVEHYAGPVHAERFHLAQRARETQVAAASTAEQHRLAFGDSPATLEAMVRVRLRSLGSDVSEMLWDAWRREDGQWQLACWFDHPEDPDLAAELESPALWIFHAGTRHLVPASPTAQRLHTLPSRPETPRRRLAPVDGPFDVEDEPAPAREADETTHGDRSGPRRAAVEPLAGRPQRGRSRSEHTTPRGPSQYSDQEGAEHEDLLDILRARRGRRLGADEESDDKLALMLTREERPAQEDERPRLGAVDQDRSEEPDLEEAPFGTRRPGRDDESGTTDAWGFSYAESGDEDSEADPTAAEDSEESFGAEADAESVRRTDELPRPGGASEGSEPEPSEEQAEDDSGREPKAQHRGGRGRRPNMPRWDDILFGSRDD
ncbi:MAG: septation protein SepH [Nesterenkonia sp.]|nr:septation protein SepH [Nesterenkonia sp.]